MSGETEKDVSGWTVDTSQQMILAVLTEKVNSALLLVQERKDAAAQLFTMHEKLLNERYATQSKATDAAFIAQQTAMQAALTAAREAVVVAQQAAEKAVLTANVAAEKRFDSVNEFRQTLTDQAATFIPRLEAESRISVVDKEVSEVERRLTASINELKKSRDVSSGKDSGNLGKTAELRAVAAEKMARFMANVAMASVVAAIIGIVVAIFIAKS